MKKFITNSYFENNSITPSKQRNIKSRGDIFD